MESATILLVHVRYLMKRLEEQFLACRFSLMARAGHRECASKRLARGCLGFNLGLRGRWIHHVCH